MHKSMTFGRQWILLLSDLITLHNSSESGPYSSTPLIFLALISSGESFSSLSRQAPQQLRQGVCTTLNPGLIIYDPGHFSATTLFIPTANFKPTRASFITPKTMFMHSQVARAFLNTPELFLYFEC